MSQVAYAHIDQTDPTRRQTLFDHLHNTARQCGEMGERVGLKSMLFYIGLLHDGGKIKTAFQEKIINQSNKKVDHSSFGGAITLSLLQSIYTDGENKDSIWFPLIHKIQESGSLDLWVELNDYVHVLTYAIMSHHGQYDFVRQDKENNYIHTSLNRAFREMKRDGFQTDFERLTSAFREAGISLERLFLDGFEEYRRILAKLKDLARRTSDDESEAILFYQSLLMRLCVSILKSADIKDTINSYERIIQEEDSEEIGQVKERFVTRVDAVYEGFGAPKGALNRARAAIADAILTRSKEDEVGIYTLDLPTGAGKTLLSLRYGVNQMKYRNKRRFFYITSYLSVLEQNAQEMRSILNEEDYVLEHHSNVVQEESEETRVADADEKEDSLRAIQRGFLLDGWTSPVVLTTMVQFFNTLFKGKSANLTRFQSLIDAVVILDELQSLPNEVLYLTNLALNFMKAVMGTTVVLSTATQPTYDSLHLRHRLDYGNKRGEMTDIVTLPKEAEASFERAGVALMENVDRELTIQELADFVIGRCDRSQLIILNTKPVVRALYEEVSAALPEGDVYYLTTNLTADDRLERIRAIKARLSSGDAICVISTQLIEAGVDVDFEEVVRSLTGIDSIIQARGRCNREGKRDRGETFIVKMDGKEENIDALKGMKERANASYDVLRGKEGNIAIDAFIAPYFEKLYANLKERTLSDVLKWLSTNPAKKDALLKSRPDVQPYGEAVVFENTYFLKFFQSFHEAYSRFNLIDDTQTTAVVYNEKTASTIDELRDLEGAFGSSFDPRYLREAKGLLRKLSRYTVPMSEKNRSEYCETILDGLVYILPEAYYHPTFGVDIDNSSGFLL